ncbi:MAG: hypothetical protein RIS43_849, partial [Actinomycetota bacterium]
LSGNSMNRSFWWDTVDDGHLVRPSLSANIECDVAIVGAGFTGLWTAYWLKKYQPSLHVVVVEREVAGFGASGRNGGWCSALFPASLEKIAHLYNRDSAIAMHRTMQSLIAEIGSTIAEEGIDCDWHHGGDVYLARNAAQLKRAHAEIAEWHHWGFTDADHRFLSAAEAQQRLNASNVLGGTYTPHCARINPAKLVRGLAVAAEKLGVEIYERSSVTQIEPRRVHGEDFDVRAKIVVRATEGFTAQLPGHKRTIIPVYSFMIATEPLTQAKWDSIGLNERELFADFRNLIIYGQRTADNRIAFGGRGAPYHFGSKVHSRFDTDVRVHDAIEKVLKELLPQISDIRITHRWGGPLAVPRDWFPSVNFDKQSGMASAGGYVGDGVATSALAGRTLAELITGQDTHRTRLPWVGHRSRSWEVEPLRWIGANASLRLVNIADSEERLTGKNSLLAAAFNKIAGR